MADQELEAESSMSVPPRPNIIEVKKPRSGKFSQFLTSDSIQISVGEKMTYALHASLLVIESKRCYNSLTGNFKEGSEKKVDLREEDPDLFGYFVEYLYRDESVITREIRSTSDYVVLARLYTLADRLFAIKFKSGVLWRFATNLNSNTGMSLREICDLLQIATTDIYEDAAVDPMRAHTLWYASSRIQDLQKFDLFRQLILKMPHIGANVLLWVNKPQPWKPEKPGHVNQNRFKSESEFDMFPTEVHETQTRGIGDANDWGGGWASTASLTKSKKGKKGKQEPFSA